MDNNQPVNLNPDPTVNTDDFPLSAGPAGSKMAAGASADKPAHEGTSFKEQKEQLIRLKSQETGLDSVKYKEYQEVELGKEVKDWMEKYETAGDVNLNQPILDDYGQILLDNSVSPKPQIILPLKEEELKPALHHKIADSVRWLAEWCARVVKLVGKRAEYKNN